MARDFVLLQILIETKSKVLHLYKTLPMIDEKDKKRDSLYSAKPIEDKKAKELVNETLIFYY